MAVVEHVTIDSDNEHGNRVIGRSNKIGGLIGYAKDTTFSSITVRNTLVKGINKVGGVAGLFTGGQVFNTANLGFRNSSRSIVEGIKSVGGILGESSSSNYVKVGVRRGIIFGESSVGAITGKTFDTEKADQLYVLKYVRLIYRSGSGSEFGGLFGSYIIEGDKKYTISNSYTKARIVGKDQVGGFIGHLNMDTPDAKVYLTNLIMDSQIKNAPNSGKLIGSLDYNANTQTLLIQHVYYLTTFNGYLGEIGVQSESNNHNDFDLTDYRSEKHPSPIAARGFSDYVEIVQRAIKHFDQQHTWCQDKLRGEQGFDAKHQICRCGPYSQDYFGNCLCSSFTELSHNKSYCINSTGVCTTPWHFGRKFVSAYENLFLEISAHEVHFVEFGDKKGNLEVKLRYTAQATAWTDIVVLGKKGAFIASLSNYLLGKGYRKEEWKQSIDKSGSECIQQSSFSLPWDKVAKLAQVDPQSGDFLLRVYAHTNLLREEKRIILRDVETPSTELITAVPILISLNTSVTTTESLSATFNLNFDIDASYYVKSTQVEPSGLRMKVDIEHSVSNPLSLVIDADSVTVDGTPTNATIVNTVPVSCGPNFDLDNITQVCVLITTLYIDLPLSNDCGDRVVSLNLLFNSSCEGPNKLPNNTVCQSVYDQVQANGTTSVPATITFDYNFCPKVEDTTLTTKSFRLRQLHKRIQNGGEVKSNHAVNGTINLNVIQTVVDSSFASANIVSVFLFEQNPSNDTVNFIDIKEECSLEAGFEKRKDEIQISFSYIPNIYLLTKLLKNWSSGLYFVVAIDVHYEPTGYSSDKKRSMMNTQVRLQIPSRDVDTPSVERTKSTSSNFVILNEKSSGKRSNNKVDTKDFTLEKAKAVNDQYERESKRNDVLMIILGGSFGITMLAILITIIIVVVKYHKKKSDSPTTLIQIQN
eukprot:TRINITY_DN474_c0_g1_i1.p1 TRINITY_DN474_c0_g1~~TRINITY_DN474_c0_g1_i1.p1  ORF type:complete len:1069 (+),score=333.24 TRINITY_DN474_c0_g1_i1:435-3209(+)